MFGNSGRLLSSGFVTRVLMVSMLGLLCACGGGGSSGTSGSGGTSSSSTPALTANAGADMTVDMGTKVTLDPKVLVANSSSYSFNINGLELTGSSTNKQDIVKLVWKKMSGPGFGLGTSGLNDGIIYFTAPTVTTDTTVVFKLTLTDAAGATAEDSITITIKRVNQKPTADAGSAQVVKAGSKVSLDASGSRDTDGTIAKYTWQQKTGTQVTLTGQTTAKPGFTAPDVTTNTDIQFEVTVEDNEGAIATQSVTVTVTPANAPDVAIFFPPAVGIYGESSISAFGSAMAANGATITKVILELGSSQVEATLKVDGTWRADNLTTPVTDSFTLKAIATDSFGRSGQTIVTLQKRGSTLGSGDRLTSIRGLALDSATNKLLVFSAGKIIGGSRLLSIDLATGNRSTDISSYNNAAQGPVDEAINTMTYDPTARQVYLTGVPDDQTLSPFVLRIDVTSGKRSLVASNTLGTGASFKLPYGTAFANGRLYVADNGNNNILKIDPATGNRITIADATTKPYGMDAPVLLAVDQRSQSPQLYMVPNTSNNYVLGLTTNTDTAATSVVTNSAEFASGPSIVNLPWAIVADDLLGKIYLVTDNHRLMEVDSFTHKRKDMSGNYPAISRVTYDASKRVIYAIDYYLADVIAIDPATGQAVTISRYW